MNEEEARLAAEADLDTAEASLYRAALDAIAAFLGDVREALLGPAGVPDLNAFPPDHVWLARVAAELEAAVAEHYRRVFDRTAATIGHGESHAAPHLTRHWATVSDRLRIWPAGAFEDLRVELATGHRLGESIDQLRDRIGASLQIDAPSKAIRDRIATARAELDASEDPARKRALRTEIRTAWADVKDAEREWHWKARRIARTESTAAVNAAALDAAIAADDAQAGATVPRPGQPQTRKQWLATSDDRVRDAHARVNGQVQFLRDPFHVGGYLMQHPGYPGAPAEQVCNCRCTLLILPPAADPLPLEPIGEDAPSNLAASSEGTMTQPATPPADTAGLPDGWTGILAPLNSPTGDGRMIAEPAELDTRPLPLPLLAQYQLADGHDGGVVVGLIDRVWVAVDPGTGLTCLYGEGPLDLADATSAQWARRLADGYAGGVSVDLDAVTMTMKMIETATGTVSDLPDGGGGEDDLLGMLFGPDVPDGHEPIAVADPWRLMSATLVSQPAFPEAQLGPVYGYTSPLTEQVTEPIAAALAPPGQTFIWHELLAGLAEAPDITVKRGGIRYQQTNGPLVPGSPSMSTAKTFAAPPAKRPVANPKDKQDARPTVSVGDRVEITGNPDAQGPGEVTNVDNTTEPPTVTVDLDAGGPVDVPIDDVKPASEGTAPKDDGKGGKGKPPPPAKGSSANSARVQAFRAALTAGGPMRPPQAWFDLPKMTGPTPLTVTSDGRVFGHLAVWGTCHIGFDGTCITPPRSNTSYALFHVGEAETREGTFVPVGKLTLGTGHADGQFSHRAAAEHYDNTGTAVAVVQAHEDEWGIAVAGAICPEAGEVALAALRRSPLSGDWRRVGGNLELVAALAVNTPGFPVVRQPRAVVAAGGRQVSLVAAGVVPRRKMTSELIADAIAEALDRRDLMLRQRAALADRFTAGPGTPWPLTRTVLARSRMDGTHRVAAAVAGAHGYTPKG